MHEISAFTFGEKGKSGWFIDHKRIPAAVSITPNSGDFLLFVEGSPCGFCLPGENVHEMTLEEVGDRQSILVAYTGMKWRPDEYVRKVCVGVVDDPALLEDARRFIASVNSTFFTE